VTNVSDAQKASAAGTSVGRLLWRAGCHFSRSFRSFIHIGEVVFEELLLYFERYGLYDSK
jgi:hypothetical protein